MRSNYNERAFAPARGGAEKRKNKEILTQGAVCAWRETGLHPSFAMRAFGPLLRIRRETRATRKASSLSVRIVVEFGWRRHCGVALARRNSD